jgi:tyrosine-protein kinase Etk/Wzc
MLLENFKEENKPEETVDFKKIFYLLVRQWKWFFLFGILGFGVAYSYNKLTKPRYTVNASILVPEKSTGMDMKNVFEKVLDQQGNNIYNQIEILKSYYPINQTLVNLNWRTSWYKKDILIWRGIFRQEPFEVKEAPNVMNVEGVPVNVISSSGDSYIISADGEFKLNNLKTKVEFESKGTFGQPFVNSYFNFTLVKKANISNTTDGNYKFVFNNLNETTLAYQKRLKVDLKVKKSDLIQCSIEGEEPIKDGEFLNELVKVYIKSKIDLENESQRRSLEFINDQLSGIADSLDVAGTKFTKFRSENKIIDIGKQGTLVMDNLKEIESDKAKSQMQLDYFNNLHTYLSNPGDGKKLASPSVVGIEDLSLNTQVVKMGELYSRRQLISFSAKENNPALLLIDKEIVQTRDLINENLLNLIDNAKQSVKSLKDRHSRIGSEMNKLPEKEQQMITIQRQFDLTNEIYTLLLKKRAETNIALASSISDVQIIDIARPSDSEPMGFPGRAILIIGFILGIAVPLGFVSIMNSLDDRIRSQEDIENKTSIPIIGNILHDDTDSVVVVSENPKSIIAESFRKLRTNLQFMLAVPGSKVISIHSTDPGEGKSFTAVNLATILAMNNKKVLVIGADMRKPKLHQVFNFSNDHGLSTYLIGYDTIEKVILPTSIKNLSLITSGPIPPNPAEILGRAEMKTLLDNVRVSFDYVILDNAPVSLVTDGIILSHLSDINIFVLRYGISHKHQLEMINQYAFKKIISHLAIVVNDIKSNAFGYSFSKYSRYEVSHKNSYQKYTTEE